MSFRTTYITPANMVSLYGLARSAYQRNVVFHIDEDISITLLSEEVQSGLEGTYHWKYADVANQKFAEFSTKEELDKLLAESQEIRTLKERLEELESEKENVKVRILALSLDEQQRQGNLEPVLKAYYQQLGLTFPVKL